MVQGARRGVSLSSPTKAAGFQEAQLPQPALPQAQLHRAIAGLMLVLMLAALDGNIVGPALPHIVSDLGGLAHLSWVVIAFAVALTASTPLYGKLSDQFGRRPAFFVAIGIFLAGSLLCGLAHSMAMLIGARALQGVGAGGLMTLTQTAIADLVSPRERGRYQGLVAGVFAICSVGGPLLGGVITDYASWPWIFFVNLPFGAAATVILAASLPHRPGRPGKAIDIAGFTLLIGATCSFLLMLSWGGAVYPWGSPQILGLGALCAAMVAALLPVERSALEPAMPPRLFADRVFCCGGAGVTLMAAALFGSLVFLPLFFQLVRGASATEAGLRMAPLMAGMIVSSIVGGRLVSRTGKLKIFPLGGLLTGALAFGGLSLAVGAGASANAMDGLLVLLGAGFGLVMPNLTTAVQSAVPARDVGVATATLGFFRSLGGAFGMAVSGAILSRAVRAYGPAGANGGLLNLGLAQLRALPDAQRDGLLHAYSSSLSATFAAACVASLLAFCIVLMMPERPLRGRDEV